MTGSDTHRPFLVLLVVAISAAFVLMVRDFLLAVLLAAVVAALLQPACQWIARLLGGRRVLAALVTLGLFLVLVIGPFVAIIAAIANEGVRVSQTLRPRLTELLAEPGGLEAWLQALPGYDALAPYRDAVLERLGTAAGGAGTFLVDAVSTTAGATASAAFQFVVLLYALFFFLLDGPRLLAGVLSYVPLPHADKQRMLDTFVSVSRATLKGTLLIALVQGALGGLAFWALGLNGALFWGAVMTVLSILPAVGAMIVWLPAAGFLLATGRLGPAVALVAFGAVVISSVDNLLRPRLVGRDIRMHDLLIFVSTVGGISLFGPTGFVLGPVLAALFVTVWTLFAESFPARASSPGTAAAAPGGSDGDA